MVKKNVTFQDIADYTHFSKTTISRYFNSPDSLTEEHRERIANALSELNYKENKVARILARGKSEFIGLILPDLVFSFYSQILNQMLHTYEKYGYKFLVFTGSEDETVERRYIEELLSYKIEGLIIMSHTIPSEEIASYRIPVVSIEREDRCINSVNTDNYMGGVQATSLLYKSGCDIFVHVNNLLSENTPAYGRVRGFMDICSEKKLEHLLYVRQIKSDYTLFRSLVREVIDDLEEKYPLSRKGIFLSNDTLANAMLNELISRYGKLPDNYRLVGFDNSPISQEAIQPISTVGQQTEVIVNTAMELLISQIEESKKKRHFTASKPVHKVITPILIPRQTCPQSG